MKRYKTHKYFKGLVRYGQARLAMVQQAFENLRKLDACGYYTVTDLASSRASLIQTEKYRRKPGAIWIR